MSETLAADRGAELLARWFHDTYERLAPSFGYETRPDTKAFDPTSANGRLMIAVCAAVAGDLAAENAALRTERDKWRAAAVATEAMMKARGTNRDYWESRAEHAEAERDAATARADALAAALRKIAGISNEFTWTKTTRSIAGELQDIIRAALAPPATAPRDAAGGGA